MKTQINTRVANQLVILTVLTIALAACSDSGSDNSNSDNTGSIDSTNGTVPQRIRTVSIDLDRDNSTLSVLD